MEFCSVAKKTEFMKFLLKWVEGENILSDVALAQRDKCHMF